MVYRFLSKFYPKNIRYKYIELLSYSNIKVHPERLLGFSLIFSLLLSIIISIDLKLIFNINPYILAPLLFFIILFLFYIFLFFHIEAKARFVEEVLPDALQLMASNLRAGFTTDRALLLSARPEF